MVFRRASPPAASLHDWAERRHWRFVGGRHFLTSPAADSSRARPDTLALRRRIVEAGVRNRRDARNERSAGKCPRCGACPMAVSAQRSMVAHCSRYGGDEFGPLRHAAPPSALPDWMLRESDGPSKGCFSGTGPARAT